MTNKEVERKDASKLYTEVTLTMKSLCILSEQLREEVERIQSIGDTSDDAMAFERQVGQALASVDAALEFNTFRYIP